MRIKYSEVRRDYTLEYSFSGETVTVTYEGKEGTITDGFDFSTFEEGDELVRDEETGQKVETEIPVSIFDSVERIDGELEIELQKTYGADVAQEVMKKGEEGFPFSRDWQEVG